MTSQEQLRDISGATAYDRDGDKLGEIGQVYYDDDTDGYATTTPAPRP